MYQESSTFSLFFFINNSRKKHKRLAAFLTVFEADK